MNCAKEVKFPTWESRKVKVTKTNQKTKKVCTFEKNIFTLYPKTMSLDETVKQLKSMISNLKLHIFISHKQWKAHEILRSNLVPGSIITIGVNRKVVDIDEIYLNMRNEQNR